MTISGRGAPVRRLRWEIWWCWVMISLMGIIVASTLYRALPDALLYPQADEDIWVAQPWRVAALTAVFYTPISLAQWLVLRRYVQRAWWWLVITLASVVVVYPGSIWALSTLHQWDLATDVWFFGAGGSSVYVVAQWVALLRWARTKWIWGVWFGATSLGWLLVLSVIAMFFAGPTGRTRGDDFVDQLYTIAFVGLYQLTLGSALAMIIQLDSRPEVT